MKDPGNAATRNLAVGKGIALTENINNLHSRVSDLQQQLDERVTADADEINSLTEQIRKLNVQIASTEGGDTSASEAGGLRVQAADGHRPAVGAGRHPGRRAAQRWRKHRGGRRVPGVRRATRARLQVSTSDRAAWPRQN